MSTSAIAPTGPLRAGPGGTLDGMASTPSPDVILVARIQAGDDRALGEIYDQHSALVHGLARRVTGDEYLAQDVTQEVFAYLWETPERVDLERGSLRTFLAMVAHRRAVDEVRRRARRVRVETSGVPEPAVAGPEGEVVAALTEGWRDERLAAGLDALPVEQRTALELAYYGGLTYKQVAQRLGVPEGTAKSRLRSGMLRLRTFLGDDVREAI